MKKQLLLLTISALVISAHAQVTLNYETHALKAETENPMILTNYQDPGEAGENVVWDFTELKANKDFTGYLNHNEADVAALANTELVEGSNKFYFDVNQNRILELGVTNSTNSYVINYSQEPVKMTYPFAYGDIEQGSYKGTYQSSSSKGTIEGTYWVHADAYGSIKLPDLTVDNVIRVKSVKDYTKKINNSESQVKIETYRWYAEAERYPVAVMIKTIVERNGKEGNPIYQAAYKDEVQQPAETKAAELATELQYEVFPNPVSDNLNIRYRLDQEQQVNISLVDITGKLIKNIVSGTQSENSYNLKVSVDELGLEPASYIIKTEIGSFRNNEVIVVE